MPNILERSTGVIYGRAVIAYDVNYFDESGIEKTVEVREVVPISNCSTPQRWWNSSEVMWPTILLKFIWRSVE